MAVDTRAKRLSMLSFGQEDLLFTPTGTVDAAARASLLNLYEGVPKDEIVVVPVSGHNAISLSMGLPL